jgi:putative ABC transport system ATP-binding protein
MPAVGDAMIRLTELELTLPSAAGPVEILRRLSLSIARGETVSVVGPAGLERPSAGRVEVAGIDLGPLDEDALALFRRRAVGIVFQAFHLVPTMTAQENVAVPLELAGRGDAFERAADCLGLVGLDHRLAHYPGQLSGGEQQRVALARAFAPEPDLLLADEPTGNLDGKTGDHVMDLLFDLRDRHGATLGDG